MPFRSEAQRRKLYATNPALAKRWEAETPPGPLPERVEPKAHKPDRRRKRHRSR